MTKPVTRSIAVNCLLSRISEPGATMLVDDGSGRMILVFKCTECGEPIMPGQVIQFDAVHAHVLGGEHGYKDLRPIHYDPCPKRKSARDVAAKAKGDRILGLTCAGPKRKIPSRGFDKSASRPMQSRPFQPPPKRKAQGFGRRG